ncbi:sigma-70 family RNA polymerase sigma factor [Terricaulis sp.]|uniref:sigma-70 family RNA polymerase sigma factor n=1 Tax=Terricaulis sp. TaxID=2768686 RepID=UPI002AC3FFAD|nr:sigma-70 family RNA polymerase sigma factor [Terricaulis sp.]MDZ4689739.1 sigma-70 family RNA polymerase sigma factor [Terricaulis sp.]
MPGMSAIAMVPAYSAPVAPARKTRTRAVHDGVGDSDEMLVARISQGDREAFAAFFGRYAARVKAYLIRLGARGAQAEDLAQDAMVAVWRRAGSFDPAKAKASTWMFVIARNAWIDRLRRERVEFAYHGSLILSEESDDESPDDAAVRGQTEAQMQEALALLSEDQREVVRLSFFEDRPHSEIAERLELPLGTVKSRLRLAIAKLRAHWEKYE